MKKTREIDYLFLTNSLSGGGAERAINIAVNQILGNHGRISFDKLNLRN
jgi:hypothetical protein